MIKVLILCTENSCRSQMAHGFLQSFNQNLVVKSAGIEASGELNSTAVWAMKEVGLDITSHISESVENYVNQDWDYVITVCDKARDSYPSIGGKSCKKIHVALDDLSKLVGPDHLIRSEFRKTREDIRSALINLYDLEIKNRLDE